MRIFIVATTRSNDPEIHRFGCGDVTRGLKSGKYADTHNIHAETAEDVAVEWWSDIIAESDNPEAAEESARTTWTKILPCTR